jgi:hypothetical protein
MGLYGSIIASCMLVGGIAGMYVGAALGIASPVLVGVVLVKAVRRIPS